VSISEFAAIIVAISVVVSAVFLITAVNNLNNTIGQKDISFSYLSFLVHHYLIAFG